VTLAHRPPRQAIPSSLIPDNSQAENGLENQSLSFMQSIRVLRKRKWAIFWTVVCCVVLVSIVSVLIRPHYKAEAEIEIQHDQSNALENTLGATSAAGTVPDDAKVEVQTEVTILQSDDLAIETIEKINYEEHEGMQRKPAERGLPLSQAPKIRKLLIKKFSNHLSVSPQEGTRIIRVGFTDTDPNYAASTTMTFLDLYMQERLRLRNSSTVLATAWIGEQISDVNKKLEASQKALTDYERATGLVPLPTSGAAGPGQGSSSSATVRSPAVDRLVQLNQSLVTAQTDRIAKEAFYRAIQSGNPDTVANAAASQLANNQIQDASQSAMFAGLLNLRQQKNSLDIQLITAKRVYGPNNPHLVDLNNQMEEINRQVQNEVKAIVSRASLDYQTALKNESGLQSAYDRVLKETGVANGKQGHLSVLQQEADSTRALYEDLYTKLEQARLSLGTQGANVALVSRALPPSEAAYPKPILYPFVSIFAGLFIGVAVAFLIEGADDSLVTGVEVESLTGLPVLTSIPLDPSQSGWMSRLRIKPKTGERPESNTWMISQPQSDIAEAFRVLRTNLQAALESQIPATLLIASPLSSEGRTVTTYNLGCSFALAGKRVLLIDADLRESALHRCAGVSNGRGLSAILSSSAEPQELIVPVPGVANLWILPAGPPVNNSSELFCSERFDQLLSFSLSLYDIVLLDSPPLLQVSDAFELAKKVNGVLLLARSTSTTQLALQRAVEQLRRLRVNLLGVSLNGVNSSSSEFYYANGFYAGRRRDHVQS